MRKFCQLCVCFSVKWWDGSFPQALLSPTMWKSWKSTKFQACKQLLTSYCCAFPQRLSAHWAYPETHLWEQGQPPIRDSMDLSCPPDSSSCLLWAVMEHTQAPSLFRAGRPTHMSLSDPAPWSLGISSIQSLPEMLGQAIRQLNSHPSQGPTSTGSHLPKTAGSPRVRETGPPGTTSWASGASQRSWSTLEAAETAQPFCVCVYTLSVWTPPCPSETAHPPWKCLFLCKLLPGLEPPSCPPHPMWPCESLAGADRQASVLQPNNPLFLSSNKDYPAQIGLHQEHLAENLAQSKGLNL